MTDNYESAVTAEADPADDMTWNDFTVPQLKEELTVRGLETTGKKAELVARLEKYDNGSSSSQSLIFHVLSLCECWEIRISNQAGPQPTPVAMVMKIFAHCYKSFATHSSDRIDLYLMYT